MAKVKSFNWNRVFDYATRAVTFTCIGVAVWGIGVGVMIHRDTMKRSQELMNDEKWLAERKREIAQKAIEKEKEDEMALAKLAQAVIPPRFPPSQAQ